MLGVEIAVGGEVEDPVSAEPAVDHRLAGGVEAEQDPAVAGRHPPQDLLGLETGVDQALVALETGRRIGAAGSGDDADRPAGAADPGVVALKHRIGDQRQLPGSRRPVRELPAENGQADADGTLTTS